MEKPLKGSEILVLGVAYKKDASDMRESPALDIIHLRVKSNVRFAMSAEGDRYRHLSPLPAQAEPQISGHCLPTLRTDLTEGEHG